MKANQNYKVSVIIPTYNVENYIEESIYSIINQTYKNIEIIVVDDCSTDKTYEKLMEIQKLDKRLIVLRNEKNSKICYSLNRALQHATGEYIVRMDGDDISELDRIEKQIIYLKEHSDVDLVGVGTINIDENGNEISRTSYSEDFNILKKISKYASPVLHIWMAKKNVYDKLNGYREMPYVEDYDFLLRMITSGYKFANISEYFGYKVRTRNGNTASTVGINQRKAFDYAKNLYLYRLKNNSNEDNFNEEEYFNYIEANSNETEKFNQSVSLLQYSRKLKSQGKKIWLIYTIKSVIKSKYQFKYMYRATMLRIIKKISIER